MGKKRRRSHSPEAEMDKLIKKMRKLQEKIDKERKVKAPEKGDDDHQSIDNLLFDPESSDTSSVIDDAPAHGDNKENNKSTGSVKEASIESLTDQLPPLDGEILEILGEEPCKNNMGNQIHPQLACRWEKITHEGLKKETRAELLDKYPRKGNCSVEAPSLNPEVEASINDTIKKRDKYFVVDQELCGGSLSALGTAISLILKEDEGGTDKNTLLRHLTDAGKLLCDLFHNLTMARKAYIYPGLDKRARALLEKKPTDNMLFGSELSDRLKTAKSMEKMGLSLKPQSVEKKTPVKAGSVNWKGPPAKQRPFQQAGYKRRSSQSYTPSAPPGKSPRNSTQFQSQAPAPAQPRTGNK